MLYYFQKYILENKHSIYIIDITLLLLIAITLLLLCYYFAITYLYLEYAIP